jgi:hypothetical protein
MCGYLPSSLPQRQGWREGIDGDEVVREAIPSPWTHLDIEVVLSKLDNFPQIDAEEYDVKPTRRYHIALSIQDPSKRGMFSLPKVVQVDIEITPDSRGGRFLLTLFQRQMF